MSESMIHSNHFFESDETNYVMDKEHVGFDDEDYDDASRTVTKLWREAGSFIQIIRWLQLCLFAAMTLVGIFDGRYLMRQWGRREGHLAEEGGEDKVNRNQWKSMLGQDYECTAEYCVFHFLVHYGKVAHMVETLKKMMNLNFQGIDVVGEATAKMKLEISLKPIALDEIDHPVLQLQMEGFGRAHCKARQAAGKQLEDSGVLSDSLRSRSNSLGLHMPLYVRMAPLLRMHGNDNLPIRLKLPLTELVLECDLYALVKFKNKAADGGIMALRMAALNGYADYV
ncbi:hypothetical protein Tco_1210146 [Tanacetum coccineum]